MTDNRDDGGPVFPQLTEIGYIAYTEGGMSMRDWFAGQAIVGLLSSPHNRVTLQVLDEFAEYSYDIADAMLEARKK